ncbi:MAG: phosphoadenylyl-sulfate reductase [Candidatus Hodarchaeales archaeon]|jgi:phosphoadenosine phosphosulfate reductase
MISDKTINTYLPLDKKINEANEFLEKAIEEHGEKLVLACSFSGPSSLIIIDLLTKITSKPKIIFINTGYHFPETLKTAEYVKEKYDIEFIEVKPDIPYERNENYGEKLWKNDPDKCCHIRKVIPFEKALSTYDAWITGLRREQSPSRKNIEPIEKDRRGMQKYNPLHNWTYEDVWTYIIQNDVPYNLLHDKNYPSIGCYPCTRAVLYGEDVRSGRWAKAKNKKLECGLHL